MTVITGKDAETFIRKAEKAEKSDKVDFTKQVEIYDEIIMKSKIKNKHKIMTTVKELRELLTTMPDDYEVVIYPKYLYNKVDGYKKEAKSAAQEDFENRVKQCLEL